MEELNKLIQELGISKVKLAKYLGVSRQMIYNYLELETINKWPKEKKLLLLKLLNINDCETETLHNIKLSSDYLEGVESRLNRVVSAANTSDMLFNLKDLNKKEHELLNNLILLLKEKFSDNKNENTYNTFLYLYHVLQSIDNVPEIRYLFGYLSKKTGFTKPNDYVFNETAQFMLESIIYTAFNLYNNGGATRSKLQDSHDRFVKEIEYQKEDQLSRTQQLNTIRIQALKELGYTEINKDNASVVFNKIAEIQSRGV
ncbi:MAG: hypothetical protein RR228_03705 [Bacilli bacterium]